MTGTKKTTFPRRERKDQADFLITPFSPISLSLSLSLFLSLSLCLYRFCLSLNVTAKNKGKERRRFLWGRRCALVTTKSPHDTLMCT